MDKPVVHGPLSIAPAPPSPLYIKNGSKNIEIVIDFFREGATNMCNTVTKSNCLLLQYCNHNGGSTVAV